MLLSRHPEGLSADHLAMLLDDKDLDAVTIRAEMSRLRRVIGTDFVASRPYRLLAPGRQRSARRLRRTATPATSTARSRYTGALLPQSVSPAVAGCAPN